MPIVATDLLFARDKFLINQRIAIDARYQVTDEQGQPVVYVVRPTYLLRNLAAVLAGMVAAGSWLFAFAMIAETFGQSTAGTLFTIMAMLGFIPVMLTVSVALSVKRHTTVYRDANGRETLLVIRQDRKWQWINWTYTITDKDDEQLGTLRKSMLWHLIRKRWYLHANDGRLLAMAKEESIILSLLRRLLGPLFGLLRTNFIVLDGDSGAEIGVFNRKFTILDKYVLDFSADGQRKLDRRLGLALGLMLDTGERR